MPRSRRPFLLVAALAIVAALAWAGRSPDGPFFALVERWPEVVAAVVSVRNWLLEVPPPPAEPEADPEVAAAPASRPLPRPWRPPPTPLPEHRPAPPPPTLWLLPGDIVRAQPSSRAPAVVEVDRYVSVAYFVEQDGWRRIRWRGFEGWVPALHREPPFAGVTEPVLPLSGRAPAAATLAAARALLDESARQTTGRPRRLGPYLLETDVEEPWLQLLDAAAAGIEKAYRERYGLEPVGEPAEAVVLFRSCDAYRTFVAAEGGPRHAAGLVSRGVVALCREGRMVDDVRATLLHELMHLLNRRAIGPALPPWLDEGLAEDIAHSRVEGSRIVAGTVAEVVVWSGPAWEAHGGLASAELLRIAVRDDELPPLGALLASDGLGFRAVQPPALAYAQASYFVRFLLTGERAPRFRAFLESISKGGDPGPTSLEGFMGEPLAELEPDYRQWLEVALPRRPV